jgi:hypothetical protein
MFEFKQMPANALLWQMFEYLEVQHIKKSAHHMFAIVHHMKFPNIVE